MPVSNPWSSKAITVSSDKTNIYIHHHVNHLTRTLTSPSEDV
nr:MAG TPA: hypothetical protein [Caudoviricetes sp.]